MFLNDLCVSWGSRGRSPPEKLFGVYGMVWKTCQRSERAPKKKRWYCHLRHIPNIGYLSTPSHPIKDNFLMSFTVALIKMSLEYVIVETPQIPTVGPSGSPSAAPLTFPSPSPSNTPSSTPSAAPSTPNPTLMRPSASPSYLYVSRENKLPWGTHLRPLPHVSSLDWKFRFYVLKNWKSMHGWKIFQRNLNHAMCNLTMSIETVWTQNIM